jgi:hypothetical protein
MPYTQEISRQNKACFLFLLDQSYSMTEPLANSTRTKCDQLALVINSWLNNMCIRAQAGAAVKDWIDVGILGYRTDPQGNPIIGPGFQGPLAGRTIVPLPDIAAGIARVATEMMQVPDEDTGEFMQIATQVNVWIDPAAEGGTPMCSTLYQAYQVVQQWINDHPRSFPPVVINITDGESQDGDPQPYADAVKSLATEDGNVLLFNCHLSMTPADPFMFPNSNEMLPDMESRTLFAMSSELPEPIFRRAVAEGFPLQLRARGMVFNADLACLIKFLDMGTRIAKNLR